LGGGVVSRLELADRPMQVEVVAAPDAGADHHRRKHEPAEAAQEQTDDRAPRRLGLPIARDGAEERRPPRMAVSRWAARPSYSALQRRPHNEVDATRRRPRG